MRDSLNYLTVYMAQQRERLQNEINAASSYSPSAAVAAPASPLTVYIIIFVSSIHLNFGNKTCY
jgi:hypothetical protein